MIIKRRVVLRVMRILYMNNKGSKRLKNWNRISLIQKKDKSDGLFPKLGLMPNIEGLDAEEAEKKLKQWRTKQKPLYIKVVRGTLENLKRQFVILDPQYLNSDLEDKEGLLQFAFWRTQMCREVEKKAETISNELLKLQLK